MPGQVERAETVPLLINTHGGVVKGIAVVGRGDPEIFLSKEEYFCVTFDADNFFIAEIGIHGVIVIRYNGDAFNVFGMESAEHIGDSWK